MLTLFTVCALTATLSPLTPISDGDGLVINELMIDPQASTSTTMGQWIELCNNGNEWVNLSEWSISNESGEGISFSSHVIPPGGYFVVGGSALLNDNGNYVPDAVWGTFSLASSGSLVLSSRSLDMEESFSWDSSWDIEPGASLERLNPGWAAHDRESWKHSTKSYGAGDLGTPGEQNSVFSNGFGQNTWAFIKAFVR